MAGITARSANSTLMRIMSASVAVSKRAGVIIRDVLKKGDLGIVEKGKNDLQTEADRSAQRCIVASLQKQFPSVSIFGEEQLDPNEYIDAAFIETSFADEVLEKPCPDQYKYVKDNEIVIWVDPLDGTSEFTEGLLDHVTVLIGVAVKGEAVGGVIYQPYYNYQAGVGTSLGRCIWGIQGLGSFGFEQKTPPVGERIIATTRSHSDWMVNEAVESCKPTSVVRVGGAGHKVLLIIEGKVHAYVFASKGCKKWDTCAPEAVLRAIRGTLTDLHGNPILYHKDVEHKNSGGVLATLSPESHEYYVQCIPQRIKDSLSSDSPAISAKH